MLLSHFTVFYFVLSWYFRVESPPDETYHSAGKILMIEATMKEIINCKHNAKSLNFYFFGKTQNKLLNPSMSTTFWRLNDENRGK